MEKNITLDTLQDFDKLVKQNTEEVSVRIVESIAEALENNKEEAVVFQVSFVYTMDTHEVYYEKENWKELLEKIIQELKVNEKYSNTVIDAFNILQKL